MRKKSTANIQPRLLTESEAQVYTSLGRSKLREFGSEIGAVCRIGRAVRFDRVILDREIDRLMKCNH